MDDKQAGSASPEAEAPRRGRLLIVDDEDSLCRPLVFFFELEHEVEALTSASEALARIRAGERFDVILCDLMMPGMSGIDLYRALSELEPDVATRMIFLTGGAFTQETQAFLDEVPNDCIEKPYALAGLREVVNRKLAQHPPVKAG